MLWFQDWGILCGSRIVTSLRKRDLHGIPPATAGPQSEGASDSSLRIPSGTIYFLIVLFAFPEVLSTLSLSPVPAREWHFRCRCPIRRSPPELECAELLAAHPSRSARRSPILRRFRTGTNRFRLRSSTPRIRILWATY